LDPAVVLSLHTHDQSAGDQHFREWDIERRWGAPLPEKRAIRHSAFYVPNPLDSKSRPARSPTRCFGSQGVQCSRYSGEARFNRVRPFYEHTFTAGVPSPGQERWKLCFTSLPARRARGKRTRKSSSISSSIFLDQCL
jgi:hypothetical protein